MEEIANIEMPPQLVATIRNKSATVDMPAVGGNDSHGIAVEAHETCDLVGAPQWSDLEERAFVRHQPHGPANVECRRAFARNDREELFLAPADWVARVGRKDGWRFIDAQGQIGEKALRH